MSLYNLLTESRQQILQKCRSKMADIVDGTAPAYEPETGLPDLYEELIEVLRISLDDDSAETRARFVSDTITASASRQHAQESYRVGYTVSQLVHGYGSICQGITEYAHESKVVITSAEFSQLNLCLDVAIAQAVAEYQALSVAEAGRSETLRLGFLAHELRNCLAAASMAHELIKRGGVGAAGATSEVLTRSLNQMMGVVDRAMAEVRMHGEIVIEPDRLQLFSLLSEIESSAAPAANLKSIAIFVEADPAVDVWADRHFMTSALSNLVDNAVKYTPERGKIWMRALSDGETAVIEVEDRCGGLPDGKTEELFAPYARGERHPKGMGLGLSIARKAVQLNHGELNARDLPGVGCIFTIRLPILKRELVPLKA